MKAPNYWRNLATEIGVTDGELWGARLAARFAEDHPVEYQQAVEHIIRQDGDPVALMVAYIQQRINEGAAPQ